jgi:TRAP-type mannitol/chloroaromatic compound transport system permease small subunit
MEESPYAAANAIALKVARGLAVAGFVVLSAMAFWILIDVCSGIFSWGLPGMVDWVEVLNVICIALPLSYVTLQGRHISMTLIEEHLSDKWKHVVELVILVGMFLYSALLAWRVSIEALYSLKMWERNDVGMIVYWFPAKIGLAVGFIMMTLAVIIQFIGAVGENRRK